MKRQVKRRHEATDPKPKTLPMNFGRPPTLPEQIAYHLAASERYARAQAGDGTDDDDFGGPDSDWEDEPGSPHELVYDEQLNRELTRYQKEHLDAQRAEFDKIVMEKRAARRAEMATIAEATRRLKKESAAAQQDAKNTEETED